MKYFYADSLDLVDPNFDFLAEKSKKHDRVPQRDDVYAHELYGHSGDKPQPYDGILVSKSLFRGKQGSGSSGKYSVAQRQRFEREGAQRFLRFPLDGSRDPTKYPVMGDCGAFAYKDEYEPPYTIDEIVEFYEHSGFTHGISLDHLILQFDESLDGPLANPVQLAEVKRRKEITLTNAEAFLRASKGNGFRAFGSAQGWSPASYADSVGKLVKMGYKQVAIGGLVPLRTYEIRAIVDATKEVTGGNVPLHLLGVTRLGEFEAFQAAGVESFDSSSPVLQAFKDARDNYYSSAGHYTAVRVPQADGPRMMKKIREGVNQAEVRKREKAALKALREYDAGQASLADARDALHDYDELSAGRSRTRWEAIERTLADKPWESCGCSVCNDLRIEVVIFRGANRNRRRGFHNLWWTHEQIRGLRGPGDA